MKEKIEQHKNITRFDYKKTHGWFVRIQFGKKRYRKFFSDRKHNGKFQALLSAIAWRDEVKRLHQIPITERYCVGAANSNTGIVGISENKKRNHFLISWRDVEGRSGHTSISIAKHGREKALEMAISIRKQKEEERLRGINSSSKKKPQQPRLPKNYYSTEKLLSILIDKAKQLGRTPTSKDFRKTKPNYGHYETRFGSWNNALAAAGLPVNRTARSLQK